MKFNCVSLPSSFNILPVCCTAVLITKTRTIIICSCFEETKMTIILLNSALDPCPTIYFQGSHFFWKYGNPDNSGNANMVREN